MFSPLCKINIGAMTNDDKINSTNNAGQILKNLLKIKFKGLESIAVLVIKKPEMQKNAPTAKKPYAVFSPNENKTGSFPKEAM